MTQAVGPLMAIRCIPPGGLWPERIRLFCLALLAMMPLLLLFWRGGADAAASIIGVCFLAVLVAQRQWSLLRQPLVLCLLVIWLLLNLMVSPQALDIKASFSRSLPWLRFALLFAATVCWLIRSRGDLKIVALAWLATLLLAMLDGLVQLLTGISVTGNPMENGRLTGPLDRPNIGMFVARLGLPLMAASIALAVHSLRPAYRIACIAAAIAGVIFILLTGERTASLLILLALVTALIFVAAAIPRFRLYSLVLLAVAATVVVAVLLSSPRILARILSIGDVVANFWNSDYGLLFGAGLDVWQAHPFTGAGLRNFQAACWIEAGARMRDGCHQHPHNPYIEWLAEAGLVGLVAYLAFILLLLWAAFPLLRGSMAQRVAGALVAGCLVLLLFPLVASQSVFSNWPALVFWTSLSMTMAVARLALQDPPMQDKGR